ncbi:MAG: glycosyltransferase family 2 protein [Desulfobacterales bacterium]|nr:glycosyltransferase family 2 protein [Desulfobacterales bacterium]
MELSVIIPAYNEEDRIVRTLKNIFSYLNRQKYQSEVIVVSDGSTDNTKDVAERMFDSGKTVSIKVFEYHPNRGKGYAVRFGIMKGCGSLLMFMDADYSVPMADVEKGRKLIADGYDIAIGSRSVVNSRVIRHQNFLREISAKLYTFIQNRYLGIRYKDTQCGFKLFKNKVATALFEKQKLDSVIFDPEILWLAKQQQFKVGEFPVWWSHVENSRIQYDSLKKSLFVFQELFRIKRLHKTNPYPQSIGPDI